MVTENELIAAVIYREYAECEFPPDLAAVAEVAGKVRTWCERLGLDAQAWQPVELALVEGLNNAVEHGCRGRRSEGGIRVRWHWTGDMLEIEIADPSDFRPSAGLARLPEPLSERGRGLFVMSSLMDGVSHEIREGCHVLILRKQVGSPPPSHLDSQTTLREMTAELSSSYETISGLFRFGEELATARSFEDFSGLVLRRLLKLLNGDEAWIRLGDGEGRLNLVRMEPAPHRCDLPESLRPEDDSVEAQVFRGSDQHTIEDCAGLKRQDAIRCDGGSAFVCPILFREATIGVLAVRREQTSPYFTASDTRLIGAVADFLGIARTMELSQERRQAHQRTERELEIAAEIQQSLLPTDFPETGRLRIFGRSQTAHEVGGDYFDVLPIGDRGVLIAIADVMGKGIPAALLAMILRTTIRAHADLAENPGHLLTIINRQLGADLNKLQMFITVQIAFFSHDNDEVIFASGGHCPLMKLSQGNAVATQSHGGGVPLGVMDEVEYVSYREPVACGDRLIFLSDGVYEAQSAAGAMLGLEALSQQLSALCAGDARTACRRVLDYVASYSAGVPTADDRTLLIVQRL
jgi:serine phosphatase RsbU (regulator of sigma subunit)/anti-sigma regulatory factor (Ser/Thr protein kinase)